jgi:hypothetical protein
VHGTVAERVNSSPNLLDVGEMGVYSSYTTKVLCDLFELFHQGLPGSNH